MNVDRPSAMRKVPHMIYHGYVTVGIGADVRRSEKKNPLSLNKKNHDHETGLISDPN